MTGGKDDTEMKLRKRIIQATSLFLCAILFAGMSSAEKKAKLTDKTLMQFFRRSIFVGDSQMRNMGNYLRKKRKEDPEFFAGVKCFGEYNLQMKMLTLRTPDPDPNAIQLTYNGVGATLISIAKAEKPKRIFILIGLNDLIFEHVDRADRYIDKIMRIRDEEFPETKVYFMSLIPVTDNREKKIRDEINEYNAWLKRKCGKTGAEYMDVTAGLKDKEGWLPRSITTDADSHLNIQGFDILIRNLLDYAQIQYKKGLWDPAEGDA